MLSAESPDSFADSFAPKGVSEGTIVFLVAAIQFINVLDFMMVMPLGPDFARGLGIPTSQLGFVSSAYALAGALTGFFGASVLDKFERKRALTIAVLGLIVGTAAGAMAQGLGTMIVARFVAGAFGGPATSIALSIVADVVPPARRGRAMSKVMGAFSIASSIGVPAGLRLARYGGWRSPFLVVAALGLVILGVATRRMPVLRLHLVNPPKTTARQRMLALFADPTVRLALLTNALVFGAAFLVIPNIAAHLQQNLGYPRPRLEYAYIVGGVTSIFVLLVAGRTVDQRGPAFVSAWGTLVLGAALVLGFIAPNRFFHLPTFGLFAIFMAGMSMRNVSLGSLSTRVPRPHERAGYMSLQSVSQQLAMGLGAGISTAMLRNTADGKLAGIGLISSIALGLSFALPFLLAAITRRVSTREAMVAVAVPPPIAVSA